MSRRGTASGTALGALVAGALVTTAAAALYLGARNAGEDALARTPARSYALLLARSVSRAGDDHTAVQSLVERVKREGKQVQLAAVVVEPRSTKYRFLRKRRYLAHSSAERRRQVLDRRHPGDKAIYDLANRVRREGRVVQVRSPQDGPFEVLAAEPVRRGKRHYATAMVLTRPTVPPPGTPAWPLAAGLGLLVLLGLVSGATLRRGRYLPVLAGVAGLALFAWWQLGQLQAFYQAHGGLSGTLVPPELARQAAPALHHLARWPLVLATLLGLGVALLGHLRVGQRLAVGLRRHHVAYLYATPAALGMLILVFVPFGYGLALGFYNHAHGTYTFVGLSNFAEILSGGGRPLSHPLNFYFTLGVTILWTASNVLFHVVIGLALALVLKDPLLRFKGIYRVLLILPWAVPNYITALIWKGMFHHQYGAVNHVLELFGIEKISWFSHFSTAFAANLVTNTWLGFPFMMVVSLGALQSIPRDVYEAAEVDGASRWQSFWHITLPLLRPALFPAIILGTIWTFNMFNIIYLVSNGAPGGSTDILITEAYRWAFERADRYGLAAAYALIILVILVTYTLLTNRMTKATEDTYS